MAENTSPIGEDPTPSEPKPASREVEVEELVTAIAGMNLFLAKLGRLACFEETRLSLPEWLVLNMLSRNRVLNAKRLSRSLGLTVERIDTILKSLQKAGLVSSDEPNASQPRSWLLTDEATIRLDTVSARLKVLLSQHLEGKERTLLTLARILKILRPVVDEHAATK